MTRWFSDNDLIFHRSIKDPSIRGYVLPHAGTKHSGDIISHTLRFQPTFHFSKVCILYYPVSETYNVYNKYFHEYYVPMKSIEYFISNRWKLQKKKYIGVNVKTNEIPDINISDTLFIISADFSHYLDMKEAIPLENKAARAIMFKQYNKKTKYTNIIDHIDCFKTLHKKIPQEWFYQWIGRSRSLGEKGVGYLSFLIKKPTQINRLPNGMFVTCYDLNMNTRECLGEWFINKPWTKMSETQLIKKVINLGKEESRLSPGKTYLPIKYYTITYLFRDSHSIIIRGYHGIKYHAFYLPEVLLEHTYPSGSWIQFHDKEWQKGIRFQKKETLQKLMEKSKKQKQPDNYELYKTYMKHVTIY